MEISTTERMGCSTENLITEARRLIIMTTKTLNKPSSLKDYMSGHFILALAHFREFIFSRLFFENREILLHGRRSKAGDGGKTTCARTGYELNPGSKLRNRCHGC